MLNIKKKLQQNNRVKKFHNTTNVISNTSKSKKMIMKLITQLNRLKKILKTTLSIFVYTSKTKNITIKTVNTII